MFKLNAAFVNLTTDDRKLLSDGVFKFNANFVNINKDDGEIL